MAPLLPHLPSRSVILCKAGSALVAVLACVVILSILLISYLVSMQLDRSSTQNYSQAIRAQEIAMGAFQEILGDLHQEIDAGSLPDGTPGGASYSVGGSNRVYVPATNLTMLPARIGFAGTDYTAPSNALPPSLLRVSRATNAFYLASPTYYDAAKLPPNRASAAPSTARSANGRLLGTAAWNKTLLLGTNVPAAFTNAPPDWIYVTRSGSRVCSAAELADLKPSKNLSNTNRVLGRYAFVMYEQGGLLDVNSAGFPSSALAQPGGTNAVAGKSYTAYADLTRLPGNLSQTQIDNLLNWRSKGSIGTSFVSFVTNSAANGFLKFKAGDSPLLSRQDLISYFKTKGLDPAALQFLSTFSRSVTAPSWRPEKNSSAFADYDGGAGTLARAYSDNAERNSATNRDLANVRVTTEFIRRDGSPAKAGEPLVRRRFPLDKIALLASPGSNPAEVKSWFGLSWDAPKSRWVYDHGDPHNILTLKEVQDLGREPDFFELLKATILSGSLGKHPGSVTASKLTRGVPPLDGPAGIGFEIVSADADFQLLKIGANIIDQFDSDSYPTAIYFPIFSFNTVTNTSTGAAAAYSAELVEIFNTAFGTENLPGITRIINPCVVEPATRLKGFFNPEIWNPHQAQTGALTGRPTEFRIRAFGSAHTTWSQYNNAKVPAEFSPEVIYDADPARNSIFFNDAGGTASPFYDNPQRLLISHDSGNATPADNKWNANMPDADFKFLAFNAGVVGEGGSTFSGADPAKSAWWEPRSEITTHLSLVMDYRGADGQWHPYSTMARLWAFDRNSFGLTAPYFYPNGMTAGRVFLARVDPRTDRFSVGSNEDEPRWNWTMQPNIYPVEKYIYGIRTCAPRSSDGFVYHPGTTSDDNTKGAKIGFWTLNRKVSSGNPQGFKDYWRPIDAQDYIYYPDPDGVVRSADASRQNLDTGDGSVLFHGNNLHARRPAILNRPFRSVGELGYAFRDLPFKSLDFWTTASADSGLLDVFSIGEEPEITAGRINPSTAPLPVLTSILAGAGKLNRDPSSVLSPAQATAVGNAILSKTLTSPLANASSLVNSLGNEINQSLSSSVADSSNKALAEAPVRALAAVSNTRTWNLLIDVIAQSGSFAPNATTLSDFAVLGEKHYWLHVAIDRFTGRIVDQQLEPVYE